MNYQSLTRALSVAVLLTFSLAASGQPAPADSRPGLPSAVNDTVSTKPSVTPLSDAEITNIVMVANAHEVKEGLMVVERATDAAVKQYAQHIATDHKKANDKVEQLAKKLGIKPAESEVSRRLQTAAETEMKRLQTLKGVAFDKAFAQHALIEHEMVLSTIDNQLLPNAKNAQLKALLTDMRATIAGHLQAAKGLKEIAAR